MIPCSSAERRLRAWWGVVCSSPSSPGNKMRVCRSQFIVWLTLKRQVVCRWLGCWWLERRRWFESPSTDFPTELPSWLHRRHDITLHHHHASCRIAFIKRTIAYTATQTCRSQRSMSSSVSQIFEVANFNGVFLEKISQKSLGRYCRFFRDASCISPLLALLPRFGTN